MQFRSDSIEKRIRSNSLENNDKVEEGDVENQLEEFLEMPIATRANSMAKSSNREKAPIPKKTQEESLLQILREKKIQRNRLLEINTIFRLGSPHSKKFKNSLFGEVNESNETSMMSWILTTPSLTL